MLSSIKKILTTPVGAFPAEQEAGETIIDVQRMSYEERKTWRLEMLRMSVKDVFNAFGIRGEMFKYRAIALDTRGHYYAVMIETTEKFVPPNGVSLAEIEQQLATATFEDYKVVIDGLYWKASPNIGWHRRAADRRRSNDQPDFVDTVPQFDHLNEFRAAVTNAKLHHSIKVDGKEYSTDLTPLNPE